MPPPTAAACVTCGTPSPGVFCPACGQRQPTTRYTLRSLAAGALRRTIGEAGALRTLWLLTVRPDRVITDYLGGRTVRYVHPAAYLLLATATFALVVRALDGPTGAGESDKLLALLIIPFIAAAARVLFWPEKSNFAEHLIAVMYLAAQVVIFLAACFVGTRLVPESAWDTYAAACAVLGAGYFAWAYGRAFAGGHWWSVLRAAIALVAGIAAWVGSVMALVSLLRR